MILKKRPAIAGELGAETDGRSMLFCTEIMLYNIDLLELNLL